jgi:hypothetical protein
LELTNEDTGEVFRGDAVETQEQTEQQLAAELDELIAAMPDPEEPAVTNWFPVDVDPVHVGRYQITETKNPMWPFPSYATWDGKSWSNSDIESWRGLAYKPE